MSNIIQVKINIKELLDKINIFKKFQLYITNKLNHIRQLWFNQLDILTPDSPCSVLTLVKVEFGIFGYKVVHKSGLTIATKRYKIFPKGNDTEFKLNKLNILKIILKQYNITIHNNKTITIDHLNETLIGRPEGMIIDYNNGGIVFIFSDSAITKQTLIRINACKRILKLVDDILPNLF